MTGLEQQLTTALRRLSEQYAQEQRQQTERLEALQRRVELLTGQMTRLTADYGALAAMLRRRWR